MTLQTCDISKRVCGNKHGERHSLAMCLAQAGGGYLLAACGPTLLSVDLANGEIVCNWQPADRTVGTLGIPASHRSPATIQPLLTVKDTQDEEDGPPAKKQKTDGPAAAIPAPSNIIRLTVSPDQQHAVAVTEDKCVRVISVGSNGDLHELSVRCMPKRPCAVQVLPDNATILCGDKFGDVYSLPLLPKVAIHQEIEPITPHSIRDEGKPTQNSSTTFKPAATNKTVHTQRNLKSLAAQRNQKNLTPKTKEPLKFEHTLLLGHVSMLTDVTYATREIDGKRRGYIITADRDEHIRVSRAPPQSHVIEGYCLGHKEFVSDICVIPGTDLLVSGGGDDWIGLWDWPAFRLLRKISLTEVVRESKVAVSGIWCMPDATGGILVVACERNPALLTLPVTDIMRAEFETKKWTSSDSREPILDVAFIDNITFVSMDAREQGKQRLRAFHLDEFKQHGLVDLQLERANAFNEIDANAQGLDDVLYGIENLRKRAHYDEPEDG